MNTHQTGKSFAQKDFPVFQTLLQKKKAVRMHSFKNGKKYPPCRHIVNETRTQQVGKRPSVSRSLLPQGGRSAVRTRRRIPLKNVLDQMNYISPNKADYLLVVYIITQYFQKINTFFKIFCEILVTNQNSSSSNASFMRSMKTAETLSYSSSSSIEARISSPSSSIVLSTTISQSSSRKSSSSTEGTMQ